MYTKKSFYLLLIAVLLMSTSMVWGQAPVKSWEAPLTLPTYKIGPPELEPMFFAGRTYQGAAGKIYPYPLYDKLLDIRGDETYHADYLENKYVKICVLPKLGGRVLIARDRTDNYNFVYRQTEIKPALIGMIGAWISGGMEWDIPNHHRSTSYLPVNYRLVKNADGSSTIWVGDIDLHSRMEWIVGITLYPNKSYVKITTKLFNGTPIVHSFLDFTNAAMHVNKNYQVIFPPDTQFAVYHAKVQFTRWPISHEIFRGVDYRRGVNVSWWKNNPAPMSFFAWNFNGNFFGGYDHGVNAGTICVQNHYVSPGAKFFEWGNGPEGRMWNRILDSQGPYLELMSGNFSDNQPDYSWIEPYETKSATQYWYPIRGIGGAKNANLNGAVNLQVEPSGKVSFGFSTTQAFNGAKVVLTGNGKTLFEQTLDISPGKPFFHEVSLPAGMSRYDLKAALLDSQGKDLISYRPVRLVRKPMPKPVTPPLPPKQIKTIGELYHVGLRLEQFHNATLPPYPYYDEALRRDPENYEVNTALGRIYCKHGLWQKAIKHLKLALARATRNYTRPKSGEADYYLGVALRGEGKNQQATDAFYRASWDEAWTAASYFQLAELDVEKGEWSKALSHLNHALDYGMLDCRAWDLKAAVLRKLGRDQEAEKAAEKSLALDPLNLWAANELRLLKASDQPKIGLGNPLQENLELAANYYDAGFSGEARNILKQFIASAPERNKMNPLPYYYLGYLAERTGHPNASSRDFRLAAEMPANYVFPFRVETVKVLEAAMKADPEDPHAPYYLGNALYYLQRPDAAIRMWQQATAKEPTFAMAWRNLSFAYEHAEKDTPKAIVAMQKAVSLDKSNPMFLYELDKFYEAGNVSPKKRLASFESHPGVAAKRSDALTQEIKLYVLLGRYDQAIQLLKTHVFHNWEGEGTIHGVYMNAYLLKGEKEFVAGKYREALKDYEASLLYPENLEVGRPYRQGRLPQIDYLKALAYDKLGDATKSRQLFQQAMNDEWGRGAMAYYRGLAALKLGQRAKAEHLFAHLIISGEKLLAGNTADEFFAKFGQGQSDRYRLANAHYLIGLGNLGKGEKVKAQTELQEAIELDVDHLGAATAQVVTSTGEKLEALR